jgi:hypothetical protein
MAPALPKAFCHREIKFRGLRDPGDGAKRLDLPEHRSIFSLAGVAKLLTVHFRCKCGAGFSDRR